NSSLSSLFASASIKQHNCWSIPPQPSNPTGYEPGALDLKQPPSPWHHQLLVTLHQHFTLQTSGPQHSLLPHQHHQLSQQCLKQPVPSRTAQRNSTDNLSLKPLWLLPDALSNWTSLSLSQGKRTTPSGQPP